MLKIMKVVKQYVPQLAQFTSYFYKNLLFYLDEEYPESADWDSQNKLAQRWDFVCIFEMAHDEFIIIAF